MTPLRIAYGDLAKSQALTVSTEVSGYPGTNAVNPHLSRVWRATTCAAEWIMFDAGAGGTIPFDTACVIGHNLTSAAVVSVQTATTDAWAPPDTASRNGDPTQSVIVMDLGPAPTAVRYARIYIDDAANPAGYVQVGRVFLCTRVELETIDRGFKVAVEDSTVVSYSLTGQVFADIGVQRKVYTLSLGIMKNATKAALLAVYAAAGSYDPVVVIPAEESLPGGEAGIEPLYACMDPPTFSEAGGWGWTDGMLTFREAK